MGNINSKRLKELIDARGEYGLQEVVIEARVSSSTLDKLIKGTYPNVPKKRIRDDICKALNVPVDAIFRLVSAGKKTAS